MLGRREYQDAKTIPLRKKTAVTAALARLACATRYVLHGRVPRVRAELGRVALEARPEDRPQLHGPEPRDAEGPQHATALKRRHLRARRLRDTAAEGGRHRERG
jgi:hypothetical protein